ncbi:DNA-directed DNA polymerase epsilon, subunit B [Serendipita sp. 399]|nr:DNA-directed DNA polymerase epsilon, subunit B [Serendipita sp. 399]
MDFRLVILKVFTRKHQLSLQADAMTLLQQILTEHEITNTEDAVLSLEILAKEYLLHDDCSTIVTKPLLQRVYETVVEKSTAAVVDGSQSSEVWDPDHHLYFIDAFEMPRWHYSLERKAFEKAARKPSVAGTSESKAMFLRDRYNIIKQIVLRNENFSPPAFAGKDRANYLKARSIYGHIDFLGKGSTTVLQDEKWALQVQRPENANISILLISDVRLDDERTLKGLRALFEQAVEADVIPKIFVLCGNFTGTPVGNDIEMDSYKDGFTMLGEIISEFPSIRTGSHFLFVPGPNDPWSSDVLPRRPIPPAFVNRVQAKLSKKASFATNPCRIKFMGQEIVIYRQDLMGKMMRNLVGVKPDLESADLKRYLVQTILDQVHLSPLALTVQAISWEFDHALRLYPMPTAVVLADNYEPYELTYEGCHVFNPGSFLTNNYGFSTFYMATSRSMPGGLQAFRV